MDNNVSQQNNGLATPPGANLVTSTAKSLGKRVAKKIATSAAGSLFDLWIPILVIVGVMALTLLVMFGGAAPVAVGGNLAPPPSSSPSASGGPTQSITPGQKPNAVFYCQWQGPWANQSYSTSTVAHTGCAPTSMAMIFSSYGITETPGQIATIFHNNGWDWPPGNSYGYDGTKYWLTTNQTWLNSMGFERAQTDLANSNTGQTLNLYTAKQYTDAGWLLYTAVENWPGVGGHQVVIENVNPSAGTITVMDPNSCPNGTKTINASGLVWYLVTPIRNK